MTFEVIFHFRSSRKARLFITIFAIHSFFLLPSFFRGEKGKRITKVVVKSHAFLLDLHFMKKSPHTVSIHEKFWYDEILNKKYIKEMVGFQIKNRPYDVE